MNYQIMLVIRLIFCMYPRVQFGDLKYSSASTTRIYEGLLLTNACFVPINMYSGICFRGGLSESKILTKTNTRKRKLRMRQNTNEKSDWICLSVVYEIHGNDTNRGKSKR